MEKGGRGLARRLSIARLRRWLLAGVVLLLVVLAGLLGYARYRARRLMAELPHRLGMDIKSETNGFTYSQSVGGRTLFTLHAAKAIQRENGKTTLHDVAITLYGPKGSNQTDSIRGDEFEYDQPNGVVRAMGVVHLDLAAPQQAGSPVKSGAKRIQVTTSGLLFLQKLGVAATDQPIQIVYGDLHGGATGADYESDTGILRLRHDVRMDGLEGRLPVHVDATTAELDRNAMITTLSGAHVQAGVNRASGDLVKVVLAKTGGIQMVNGTGHVEVQQGSGAQIASSRMHAELNAEGKLHLVQMDGNVTLRNEGATGSAGDAVLHFDALGQATQAELQHAVHLEEKASLGRDASTLTADRVVASLQQNARKHTELREATATGSATLHTTESVSAARPGSTHASSAVPAAQSTVRNTTLSADTLHAVTAGAADGRRYIARVEGSGRTRIDQSDDAGNRRTSTGDALQLALQPPAARGGERRTNGALQSAVQTGNVTVQQHTPAVAAGKTGPATAQDTTARAGRAEFDGTTSRLILTGAPSVNAPGVQLSADRIALQQATGDAEALGSVKGNFVQQPPTAPSADVTHVLAERATVAGSGGAARFFGDARPARMWNSSAQIDAPELDLDRAQGTLAAHAAAGGPPATVHLLLNSEAPTGKARESGPVRISGQVLTMTAANPKSPGRIDVSHAVRVITATSDVSADHVTALLRASQKPGQSPAAGSSGASAALAGGSVQSVLATGGVRLQQPGRVGVGDKLIYTTADGRYELTGTSAAPPVITDSLRGTLTGDSLIFHAGDDSVEVVGEAGRRVHTETNAARPGRKR